MDERELTETLNHAMPKYSDGAHYTCANIQEPLFTPRFSLLF